MKAIFVKQKASTFEFRAVLILFRRSQAAANLWRKKNSDWNPFSKTLKIFSAKFFLSIFFFCKKSRIKVKSILSTLTRFLQKFSSVNIFQKVGLIPKKMFLFSRKNRCRLGWRVKGVFEIAHVPIIQVYWL